MTFEHWWEGPMRVLQYNLQIKDTPHMEPERIAEDTSYLKANVVVLNVGGIYAWYQSKVLYHHINEYLPAGRDLLQELIAAFHARGIKFIARFDFSVAEDTTYLYKPEWFARDINNNPYYRGEKRMGNWSLLLDTCSLGGYRNKEVAVPVLQEVLRKYDIDGVFLNAPHARECHCSRCRALYKKTYNVEMPDNAAYFDPEWLSKCMKINIGNMYKAIKEIRTDVPLVLYYAPFSGMSKSFGRIDRDNLYDRYATADLICTESQDVLSRGINNLPMDIHPLIAMKAGELPGCSKRPFGIIHSCPGMDWRHVGMPPAEYLPWMAQVPASNGIIWHSVTGFCETITDKRILESIRDIDSRIQNVESDMRDAFSFCDTALLWNGSKNAVGWAEMLVKNHIQFDLIQDYIAGDIALSNYRLLVIPGDFIITTEFIEKLSDYMSSGGKVIFEGTDTETLSKYKELFGIEGDVVSSENLVASYLRFEDEGEGLADGIDSDKIELRGKVSYCNLESDNQILMTLIPPFAPYEAVGIPPERASLPVENTTIPMAFRKNIGRGSISVLIFPVSSLFMEYGLSDHLRLIGNLVNNILGDNLRLRISAPADVYTEAYQKDNKVVIHFINEMGKRPLIDNVPVHDIMIRLRIDGKNVNGVESIIENSSPSYYVDDGCLVIKLPRLKIWDAIRITF